jgi:hypothetical protein
VAVVAVAFDQAAFLGRYNARLRTYTAARREAEADAVQASAERSQKLRTLLRFAINPYTSRSES